MGIVTNKGSSGSERSDALAISQLASGLAAESEIDSAT